MVRAELEYNPYLLETKVRFNGNPPRINCQVEKYQNEKLQLWVRKIPGIFHDEMNGYDFELDFTGTELDFEELKKSFEQADVGKDRVVLFHKGVLDGRYAKVQAIDQFLKWLDETPNRKFNVPAFREKYVELFEGAYPLIVVGGTVNIDQLFEDIEIRIESVNSVDELKKINLQSTPIIIYLDRKTISRLQYTLRVLFTRSDVVQDQLFFYVSPVLGSKVERVLLDLGVKEPQIIESVSDTNIHRFFEIYPVTEYVQESIKVFREQAEELNTILQEENKNSKITNRDIHEKINNLEDALSRLKKAQDLLYNKDNLGYPNQLTHAKGELLSAVGRWKNKKVKITRIEEAEKLSVEYDAEVRSKFEKYKQEVQDIYKELALEITKRCRGYYLSARYNKDIMVDSIQLSPLKEYYVPGIAAALMDIKEEQFVMPKEDFLGKLLKTTQDNTVQELVLETTFFYEKWRTFALKIVEAIAERMNQEIFSSLCKYYDEVSCKYLEYLEILIQEITNEKDQVSSRLSEDERLLQEDNDWYITFCDMLQKTERA